MTNSSQTADPTADSALTAAEVENVLSTMGKALRAFNMYQANNPVFKRFDEALHRSVEDLWRKTDVLELSVRESGFRWDGQEFALGQGRDSLAFAFYKDGVRFLKLLPGFEDEVSTFLKAVNRALRREGEADDLITVLWEEDFVSLQYGYVDLLMEGVAIPDEPEGSPAPLDVAAIGAEAAEGEEEAEEGAEEAGAAGGLKQGLTRDDFDETLYFLDNAELSALQTQVDVEMERDLRTDVLNALFDRLEEPEWPERQDEILDILDQLLPLFLSRGDLGSAARILQELDRMVSTQVLTGALRERVEELFARLSDPEVLEQFVQALEDGAVSPEAEEVNLFFSRLHADALPVLIRFSEMAESAAVRERLEAAIDGLAQSYPAEVNTLFQSDELVIVRGAARVAGRTELASAVPALHTALKHRDRDVRMAVVESLVQIRTNPALNSLQDALEDTDRDVRIAAVRALGEVRFASARDRLARLVDDRRMKDADLTEKLAFFEAFGAVGGNAAVERLSEILNRKGLLGRRNPTETRACAAMALGQAATPTAREALEKARDDDDPVVRNAVLRALRQETQPR